MVVPFAPNVWPMTRSRRQWHHQLTDAQNYLLSGIPACPPAARTLHGSAQPRHDDPLVRTIHCAVVSSQNCWALWGRQPLPIFRQVSSGRRCPTFAIFLQALPQTTDQYRSQKPATPQPTPTILTRRGFTSSDSSRAGLCAQPSAQMVS